jgi:two-component system, NarL family, response regulator NreC
MPKHTVVLADDHHLVRQGFRSLLQTEPDLEIVGEAGDGLEAVRLTEQLQPDILVTDLLMPALTGIEVVNQVQRRVPKTRVVVLSMHRNEAYVLEALRHGAMAFVLKDATASEFLKAIREVLAGRKYLGSPFSDSAIEAYVQKARGAPLDAYDKLTVREREVLQLKAEGRTTAEIAQRLFISPRTVEIHRTNFMRKLGLRSQTDVIRFALSRGLLADAGSIGPAEQGFQGFAAAS